MSAFTSATEMAPYYLATMLCLTPLSILAGPVAQFFQPRLIRAIASGDTTAAQSVLRPFVTAIVFITFLPSALLWLVREPVISAWLGHSEQVTDVAHYTAILLPGVAIGALGYVPYLILVARQDYRFQARASMAMTALTLVATVLLAHNQSVEGVCWVYTIYHASSTLMSWARCILGQSAGAQYAPDAALRTLTLVAIASLTVMVVAITAHLI